MNISDLSERKSGRPRSEKAHKMILKAVLDLLFESGMQGVSMEAVAERAGVGKTTIYRRWSTKEDLIAEAINSITEDIKVPDTGNTFQDVVEITERMVENLSTSQGVNGISKLFSAIMSSPNLTDIYLQNFVLPRRNAIAQILERGKQRRDIREDVDVLLIIDMLSGIVFYSAFFHPENLQKELFVQKIGRILKEGISQNET